MLNFLHAAVCLSLRTECVCIFTCFIQRDSHTTHVLSLFLPRNSHQFLSVYACVYVCVLIIAKSPSSMMGSKWATVVYSKQRRLAALEDRVLSEHRKTFLSLLMYFW